jgi:hypothetical protein
MTATRFASTRCFEAQNVLDAAVGSAKRQTFMNSWLRLSVQMTKLAVESQWMILQRLSRLQVGGPGAQEEAAKMVTEKAAAAATETFALGSALASGTSLPAALGSTVKSYRGKVAANRRRLRRGAGKRSK